MSPNADLKHFTHQKTIFWYPRKSIWGQKRPISESYEINLAIWGFFRLGTSPMDHFSSLCHEKCGQRQIWGFLTCRKNIFWGSTKSKWTNVAHSSPKLALFGSQIDFLEPTFFFRCVKCIKSTSGHISYGIDQKNGSSSSFLFINIPQIAHFSL